MSDLTPNDPDDLELIQDADDVEEGKALKELGITLIQAILEKEPLVNIRDLIEADAPLWFQDDQGTSPLHAAAYVGNDQLVKTLLEEGALWNLVDKLGNTAGDIALSMNDDVCYTLIRDAGIRAELLLSRISSNSPSIESSSHLMLRTEDASAANSNDAFLSSRLQYTKDPKGQEICLLKLDDGQEVGVMMGWERDIMRETVDRLCLTHPKRDTGLRVLNVGFGLGIVDTMFQSLSNQPSLHVIVEAHPDVLAHMQEQGWNEKQNVKNFNGKWQDVLSSDEFLELGKFDVVYTDTFAENYRDLHEFFRHLPNLLDGPDARFSFFNGLAATNALFYDVYVHVSECHLSDIGTDVQWHDVEVRQDDPEGDERWGGTRPYFTLPIYRLPIVRLNKE